MALNVTGQSDWGGGIFRGRKAPENSLYDVVNGLLDNEANLLRRGGSAYKSNADAGATLTGIFDGVLLGGQRTMLWRAGHVSVLGADDATVSDILAIDPITARPAVLGGVAYFPHIDSGPPNAIIIAAYAGSRKATYTTGTITVAAGSTSVTGSGTSWLANVDKGMFLSRTGIPSFELGPIASVDSDTGLTLVNPAETTVTASAYSLHPTTFVPRAFWAWNDEAVTITSAGQRLLLGFGSRAWFTQAIRFGFPDFANGGLGIVATQYVDLPGEATISGSRGIGDSALLFTTAGMWEMDNLSMDAVDDAGNPQYIVRRVNDSILWGDAGLAGWQGAVVVPAIDDVYLLGPDGALESAGAAIQPILTAYVKAGYQPGIAATHRGHLFLPVLNGSALVDVLVCRLDRNGAWTRWADHAAGVGYAERVGASTRTPKLLGLAGQRVTDLTGTLDPVSANASDADGTEHVFMVETRDYPTSATNHPGTVARIRLRYELEQADGAAPQLLLGWTSAREDGAFAPLDDSAQEGGDVQGGLPSAGDLYSWWHVGKQRERIRFRIFTSGEAASFTLRTLELLVRQSGLR